MHANPGDERINVLEMVHIANIKNAVSVSKMVREHTGRLRIARAVRYKWATQATHTQTICMHRRVGRGPLFSLNSNCIVNIIRMTRL